MYNDILDSQRESTDKVRFPGFTGVLQSMKSAVSKAGSSMLAATKEMCHASNLDIEFWKEEFSEQLNALFAPDGL